MLFVGSYWLTALVVVYQLNILKFFAAIALLVAGLEFGVPGASSARRLLTPAILLSAGFVTWALFADVIPGPAASMVGKRAHCFLEALALALPPYALALFHLRRRILYHRAICGAAVGAAAAMIPALLMQIACMHDPAHAMGLHFPPILIVALAGGVARPRAESEAGGSPIRTAGSRTHETTRSCSPRWTPRQNDTRPTRAAHGCSPSARADPP